MIGYLGEQIAWSRDRKRKTVRYVFDVWQRDPSLTDEVIAWCVERFGEGGPRWIASAGFIYVYDPNDAFDVRIRWC